jgi:hypothetical protein
MKHEYHEGPEAAEKFEKMAKRIFRAPKSSAKPVPKKYAVRRENSLVFKVYYFPFLSQKTPARPLLRFALALNLRQR